MSSVEKYSDLLWLIDSSQYKQTEKNRSVYSSCDPKGIIWTLDNIARKKLQESRKNPNSHTSEGRKIEPPSHEKVQMFIGRDRKIGDFHLTSIYESVKGFKGEGCVLKPSPVRFVCIEEVKTADKKAKEAEKRLTEAYKCWERAYADCESAKKESERVKKESESAKKESEHAKEKYENANKVKLEKHHYFVEAYECWKRINVDYESAKKEFANADRKAKEAKQNVVEKTERIRTCKNRIAIELHELAEKDSRNADRFAKIAKECLTKAEKSYTVAVKECGIAKESYELAVKECEIAEKSYKHAEKESENADRKAKEIDECLTKKHERVAKTYINYKRVEKEYNNTNRVLGRFKKRMGMDMGVIYDLKKGFEDIHSVAKKAHEFYESLKKIYKKEYINEDVEKDQRAKSEHEITKKECAHVKMKCNGALSSKGHWII